MNTEIRNALIHRFQEKNICILGFGREGQSSYALLRSLFPEKLLILADANPHSFERFQNQPDKAALLFSGDDYLKGLTDCDLVLKSPGVRLPNSGIAQEISSQTKEFLQLFRNQVIGVTGTKGKSTTASLIYHLLKQSGLNALLTGNIGVPAFDILDKIAGDSLIVYELSAHQLQDAGVSPHIAVLLNIWQEHLDFFASYDAYRDAKLEICRHQATDDYFIYGSGSEFSFSPELSSAVCLPFGFEITAGGCRIEDGMLKWFNGFSLPETLARKLPGRHNLLNIMAAVTAALCAGAASKTLAAAISSFSGLPHRLEYLGEFGGKNYYNDSIATIPQACIQALTTLGNVSTLILGGFDRGIDYSSLIDFLAGSSVGSVVFIGIAGERMNEMASASGRFGPGCFKAASFDAAVQMAIRLTPEGGTCLLSPAASSYDEFRNFEHRGDRFRELTGNQA